MKEPTPPSRTRFALGAAGVGLVALVGAGWLFRLPIIEAVLVATAAEKGLDLRADVTRGDFSGITLDALSLGADGVQEVAVPRLDVDLAWSWGGPRLKRVAAQEPILRVRIDETGVKSAVLDAVTSGPPSAEREPLPPIEIVLERGVFEVASPLGTATGTLEASGTLTRDFAASLRLPETSLVEGERAIERLSLSAQATTQDGALAIEGSVKATRIAFETWALQGLDAGGRGRIPAEIDGAAFTAQGVAEALQTSGVRAELVRADLGLDPAPNAQWRGRALVTANKIAAPHAKVEAVQLTLSGAGELSALSGDWRIKAATAEAWGARARSPEAAGAFALTRTADEPIALSASGALNVPAASVAPKARAELLASIPQLDGLPGGGALRSAKASLDAGLTDFATAVRGQLDWRGDSGRLTIAAPLALDMAGGRRALLSAENQAVFSVLLPSGAVSGQGELSLEGPGLPNGRLSFSRFSASGQDIALEGRLALDRWEGGGDLIAAPDLRFKFERAAAGGMLEAVGAPTVSSRDGALAVDALRLPLDLAAQWSGDTYVIALRDGCAPLSAGWIKTAGHRFDSPRLSLCPTGDGGAVAGVRPNGARYGGFIVNDPALAGVLLDDAPKAAQLRASHIVGRNIGSAEGGRFEIVAENIDYRLQLDPQRPVALSVASLFARTSPGDAFLQGRFEGGRYDDAGLGAAVEGMAGDWSLASARGETVLALSEAAANVRDLRPAGIDETVWRPRFNPLQVRALDGALRGGRFEGVGELRLAQGERRLGALTVAHDLESAQGAAVVRNPNLAFSDALDLYEITELARGVVDQVRGNVGYAFDAQWNGDGVKVGAAFDLADISFNTSSLGPVEGVSGRVAFDDFLAMTTPPGQTISVRRINPGVVVENGQIAFRMKGPELAEIQSAVWPFAGGELAIVPREIAIGPAFDLSLALRDVDAALLFEQLQFKDIAATGTLEGVFPLVFTKTGGSVVNGRLRAGPGGGLIQYTGAAGEAFEGVSKVAFEALRSFRYDNLELELDGELDGQLVTAINFSGENLAPIGSLPVDRAIPIPGIAQVDTTGLDFRFRISVRAPFRELVKGYSSTQDARPLVDEALREKALDQGEPAQ